MQTEEAMFGAGCFWGIEETFRTTPGVLETAVGYAGGHTENPTYEDVGYRHTNHAEVVHVKYDPSEITYEEILNIFWKNHNPTLLRQYVGDVKSQYRSMIFHFNDDQKNLAKKSKDDLMNSWDMPREIYTEILPSEKFWRAEEHHQKYIMKRGGGGSCHI